MKRLWLILLSLGLIAAFSTSAMAVDLKFSGEFYAAGMYQDKTTLAKDWGPSTAFYFQRLRLRTDFIVAPGLTLTTRLDAMERSWGAARTAPDTILQGFAANVSSAGTIAENENIAFDLAYLTYVSPIGIFSAGYQIDGAWGTVFGDNSIPTGKVSYIFSKGPITLIAQMGKNSAFNAFAPGIGGEQSFPRGQIDGNVASDRDNNFYTLAGRYAWNSGQAGFLYKYVRIATLRGLSIPALGVDETTLNIHVGIPYFKAQFGPVALQGEIMYAFGNWNHEGLNGVDRRAISVLNTYLDAVADFDMFYFGGTFAYLSGQDPRDPTTGQLNRQTQGIIDGGWDWNPMLILFNSDRTQWAGNLAGWDGQNADTAMRNAWFLQVRGGIRPIEKLDLGLSVSYANAVVKPTAAWLNNNYGWEVDLTGTYKITTNLSYMLGAGYLFTGKYFKGEWEDQDVQNNFLVINKLTLTF
ncbi:MAG: hypothetical protein ACYDGO_05720 [Smithellaceae bacterium]